MSLRSSLIATVLLGAGVQETGGVNMIAINSQETGYTSRKCHLKGDSFVSNFEWVVRRDNEAGYCSAKGFNVYKQGAMTKVAMSKPNKTSGFTVLSWIPCSKFTSGSITFRSDQVHGGFQDVVFVSTGGKRVEQAEGSIKKKTQGSTKQGSIKQGSIKKNQGDFFVNTNPVIPSLIKALGGKTPAKKVVKPPMTITMGYVTPGEPKKAYFFGCK